MSCEDNSEIKQNFTQTLNQIRHLKCRKFRDWTNYPDIYSCYWGGFGVWECRCYTNSYESHKESVMYHKPPGIVIKNRNKFVKEYNVLSNKRPNRNRKNERLPSKYMDHSEYYQCHNAQYIHLFSPYGNYPDDCYSQYGYKNIDPLYALTACTFMKFLPKYKPSTKCVYKAWLREHKNYS
jgi:hypothetical protein